MSPPLDPVDQSLAIYMPGVSRSLLEELAGHLRGCFSGTTSTSIVLTEDPDVTVVGADPRAGPSTAELADALATIKRTAAFVSPLGEHERLKRDCLSLERQVSEYERSFASVTEKLQYVKDESAEYKRRFLAAEEKLEVLMSALTQVVDLLPIQASRQPAESWVVLQSLSLE